jgi:uncharacterized protein (TIGR02246 family)
MNAHGMDRHAEPTADREAVLALNARFYEALRSMLAGDSSGFGEVFSHSEDVVYLPAEGGVIRGYENAAADWRRQADASLGGHVDVVSEEVLLQGDVSLIVTLTRVVLNAPEGPRALNVRESSVCRREDDQWRIVAHHADALGVWDDVVGTAPDP